MQALCTLPWCWMLVLAVARYSCLPSCNSSLWLLLHILLHRYSELDNTAETRPCGPLPLNPTDMLTCS